MEHTILIIDDSMDIHDLLRVRLQGEGRLLHAHDARTGVEMARDKRPDLILLDVNLADTSGFEVCRTLKAEGETAGIPIIFLSGEIEQETKVRGLELGAMDYITKPFDVAELRARVRSALRIKALQDQLIALARIDELTQVWNRAYFESFMTDVASTARRHQRPFAVILVDLDHFKQINDTYGHPAGDAVLRTVATLLRTTVRSNDAVCRYGGEEFAVILPDTIHAEAVVVGDRCRAAIASTLVRIGKTEIAVTASLGVCGTDPTTPLGPERMLALADEALYEAKRMGRNCVRAARHVEESGA